MVAWCRVVVVLLGLLLVGSVVPVADSFRVLGIFPLNSASHNTMFRALMEALADRGHEVVQLSPYPQKKPRANYTDLDLSKVLPSLVNSRTFEEMTSGHRFQNAKLFGMIAGPDLCRLVFETKHFKDIMSGVHGKFDVVFTEIFGSDCWTAVAYKLKIPLINMVSAPDFPWIHARIGSVDNPSYIITAGEPMTGRMNLWERAWNLGAKELHNYLHKYYVNDPSDAVVREFFGEDTPPISELVKRASLVMLNYHVSVNPARPVNPNVIAVGGLHLKDARLERSGAGLDPDLRRWMDEAEHGVILLTLGSLVRSNSLPAYMIEALIAAFAAVPQRVLWKYEDDGIADRLSPNVRTASWIPQMDVLAHPKTVLFISHGGMMGSTEAVLMGVPMLGIPLFGDQKPNILLYTALGIAEYLDYNSLTKDNVLATISKLTSTDKYRTRSKELAALYSDRPLSAKDEAVWWTEYVVRNKGAPHLRPLGADLPLYQYLLLDVAAILLAGVIAVLLLVWAVVRRLLCARRSSQAEQSKQKRH